MRRREFQSRPRPYAARVMRVGLDLARLPLPRLLAIALVLGQHGMASGPNPSLNPPGLSPPSPGRPLSSSGPDAAAISQQHVQQQQQLSSSPDNSPSASVRFRGVGQGILVPDMYATINEGFHAARSPDVYFLPAPRSCAASVHGFPRTRTVLGSQTTCRVACTQLLSAGCDVCVCAAACVAPPPSANMAQQSASLPVRAAFEPSVSGQGLHGAYGAHCIGDNAAEWDPRHW